MIFCGVHIDRNIAAPGIGAKRVWLGTEAVLGLLCWPVKLTTRPPRSPWSHQIVLDFLSLSKTHSTTNNDVKNSNYSCDPLYVDNNNEPIKYFEVYFAETHVNPKVLPSNPEHVSSWGYRPEEKIQVPQVFHICPSNSTCSGQHKSVPGKIGRLPGPKFQATFFNHLQFELRLQLILIL